MADLVLPVLVAMAIVVPGRCIVTLTAAGGEWERPAARGTLPWHAVERITDEAGDIEIVFTDQILVVRGRGFADEAQRLCFLEVLRERA